MDGTHKNPHEVDRCYLMDNEGLESEKKNYFSFG